MPLLNQEQIAERIALYQKLSGALARVAELDAALPAEAPEGMLLTRLPAHVSARCAFVVRRAWPSLRKAVMADAEKELAEAEAAVLKFEAGEEVDAPAAGDE